MEKLDGTIFLKEITEKLNTRIRQLEEGIEKGQKEIENMHTYYWENYTEMDEYGYENYDNQQALFRQADANHEKIQLKYRFEKMKDSPFFARVDFRYEDEEEAEVFYIGIGNFAETAGTMPLIYDWRAPVSTIRGRRHTKPRQEEWKEKSVRNGSIKLKTEKCCTVLRVT